MTPGDDASDHDAPSPVAYVGPPHPLEYASPAANRRLWLFRTVLGVCAGLGILANLGFIYESISSLHRTTWAYRLLMQNPQAFGREVAPAVINSLRDPYSLWASCLAFILAAAFGTMLAVHLLVAVVQFNRRPLDAARRLETYLVWKRVGAVLTAVTFFWAGTELNYFWEAATRHVPVGSGPPIFSTLLLFACAMLPRWWIGKGQGSLTGLLDDAGAAIRALPSRMSLASVVVAANYLVFGIGVFFDFFGGEIDQFGAILCRGTYWLAGPLVVVACLYSPLRRFVLPKRRWDLYGPSLAIIGYAIVYVLLRW